MCLVGQNIDPLRWIYFLDPHKSLARPVVFLESSCEGPRKGPTAQPSKPSDILARISHQLVAVKSSQDRVVLQRRFENRQTFLRAEI